MRTRTLALALIIAFILPFSFHSQTSAVKVAGTRTLQQSTSLAAETSVPAPETVLGFRPGDDRRLASWRQVNEYFKKLDAASARVKFDELGKTTMGAPFVMATISAPENMERINEFKEIQRKLADPRHLGANADAKAARLIEQGKTIVLITCGIHSDEVGSYLSSMLIAYRLASSNEPLVQEILRNTIVLLVPSLNPDGVDIIKNWYDKTLGTPYEGTNPPALYHKYTGHDNNRDWYAFTQVETQITVDKIHNVWHPQIVHDIHQQGADGARLFLPPYMKPVEPNVPRQIVEGYTELGLAMATELRAAGFKGITWDSTYDAWTPARAYSHYHGGVRILSETASAKIATPVTIKYENLRGREGYDAFKASPNYPEPWAGGEWRLRDITNYMTTAAFSLLGHAAKNRSQWLGRFYDIGREAVSPRKKGELFAYVIPPSENRGYLAGVLDSAGVEVITTKTLTVNSVKFPADSWVVLMAQPYGSFAKALLEPQRYPDLRDATGKPQPPYDVTAHTLSMLLVVEVKPIYAPFNFIAPREKGEGWNGGCGDSLPPRRAIYRSHVPAMDEGWTRWVLDYQSKCIYYLSLVDAEIRSGNLRDRFDTIIIPDQTARLIFEGHKPGSMPAEYTGGLGTEGVKALREFVEQGGTLVCLNRASDFAITQFGLPVRDLTEGLKRTEFYAPGSILRTELDTTHPLAKGMPQQSIAWVENSPVFEISEPKEAAARVRVVARYPATSEPLLSGWLLGGERLRGKAALVEVAMGKGRVILFGFRPQYRGQSLATYPLFFNSIAYMHPRK
jgi:hypothetical protein